MKQLLRALFTLLLCVGLICGMPNPAWAFCGFYVSKADTKLYNKASQVAIARDGNRTVLTMANDFQGDVKDFALVVPVPVVLKEEQVNVANPKILERLDAFSAPRLVEYFDSDPCAVNEMMMDRAMPAAPMAASAPRKVAQENSLGVTIESKFTVGEYDILILSAKESNGLETWLNRNGYRMPKGASDLLQPYIRQKMKFFVAKVNLKEFANTGFQALRPLQMAFESPKFMLPIRLGMINAQSEQDLIVYLLSPQGQGELVNYRTVKIPSDANIPTFIKQEFGPFYKSLFQTAHQRQGKKVAFLEYAWDMGNCDPCSADPLSPEELRQAGVFWLDTPASGSNVFVPPGRMMPMPYRSTFITRLHVRYSRDKFPEDLVFHETSNQQSFQGRYILNHPYTGNSNCSAAQQYRRSLPKRFEQEAQTLAQLTGWDINTIRKKAKISYSPAQPAQTESAPWWRRLWPR